MSKTENDISTTKLTAEGKSRSKPTIMSKAAKFVYATVAVYVFYGFFNSIYKFRQEAFKSKITVRDINDLYIILAMSVLNLVIAYFLFSFIITLIRDLDHSSISVSQTISWKSSRGRIFLMKVSESKRV